MDHSEIVDLHGRTIANAYKAYVDKIEFKNRNGGVCHFQDSMRSKVYKAERLYRQRYGYGNNLTIKEVDALTKKVFESVLWKKHENKLSSTKRMPTVEVAPKGGAAGLAYHSKIYLNPSYCNEFVLLHELAHTNGHRDHHQNFRAAQIAFMRRWVGKEEAAHLEECYKEAGLKTKIYKPKKPKTFDIWYKGYLRMQKARAARD